MARYTRRFVLQGLIAALPATLIACGQQAPATTKPAETKPLRLHPPRRPLRQRSQRRPSRPRPRSQPRRPSHGTAVTGANIGGASRPPSRRVTGRGNEPDRVQGANSQGEWPDDALLLAVRRVPHRRPEVHRRRVQEARPEPLARDHRVPGLNEQRVGVKAALAAQSHAPDIIAVEPGAVRGRRLHQRQRDRLRQDLRPGPEYKRGFWPNALELLTINGAVRPVPAVTNTVIVYYNKGLFAQHGLEVPETLDELKKMGAVLNAKGIAPIAYPAGQDRNFPIFPFYTYAGGTKADTAAARGGPRQLKPWTSPRAGGGGEKFVEMMAKSGLLRQGRRSASRSRTRSPSLPTASRRCSGVGSGCAARSGRRCPRDFDLGIFPFPAVVAGGHKPVLSSVGITLTVNARSKHPDLAFEMIKALTGAWGKIEYTRNLGLSPNGPISAEAHRVPDAVAQGSALSRVPEAPADRHHPRDLHAAGRGGADPGHAGALHGAEDPEGRHGSRWRRRRRRPVSASSRSAEARAVTPRGRSSARAWRRHATGYLFIGPALAGAARPSSSTRSAIRSG